MPELEDIIKSSNIPYPHRQRLFDEIKSDLEFGEDGPGIWLTQGDLRELEAIHATKIQRLFALIHEDLRKGLEIFLIALPIAALIYSLLKERLMIEFFLEGGLPGMITILLAGALLIGRELMNAFRLLILRDHSSKNLNIDTRSSLIAAMIVFLGGFAWSLVAVYVTFKSVIDYKLPHELLIVGTKESLGPILMATLLTLIALLLHYTVRRCLRLWQAPIA